METNKAPTSTSTTVSATSATINPLFDPVALQTTYLAAVQQHNQLQQNSHLAATADTSAASASTDTTNTNNVHTSLYKTTTPASHSSFMGNDRLYSLLSPQLQHYLKQQQRNFLQQQQSVNTSLADHFSANASLAHHFSAFSPINAELLGVATSTSPLLTQTSRLPPIPQVPPTASPEHAIDLLLMQMQMATAAAAAAAGFFPNAFSVLPPVTAAAFGLLAPHFRMLQLGDPNFSATPTPSGLFAGDVMSKNGGDTSATEGSLLQTQINLLANGSSLLSAVNDHEYANGTVPDTCNSVTSSLIQQLNPFLNHSSSHNNNSNIINNNGIKQQRMQLKRPHDEMSILRSLCSENHTAEQDTAMIASKRSKLTVSNESGRRCLQKSTKACNSGKSQQIHQQKYLLEFNNTGLSDGSSKNNKNAEEHVTSSVFDENSSDRHHPLNHRPPALEARFLECMAAIALHSNIPLPINDENMISSTNVDEKTRMENGTNGKSEKKQQSAENIEAENLRRVELRSISSPDRSGFNENASVTGVISNGDENKKCWLHSAIDEELRKELENYKDSDVPVIHAFVLPAKLPDSTASHISDEKCSQDAPRTMVPESVTVPVPILNTLLDRILQTMLDS